MKRRRSWRKRPAARRGELKGSVLAQEETLLEQMKPYGEPSAPEQAGEQLKAAEEIRRKSLTRLGNCGERKPGKTCPAGTAAAEAAGAGTEEGKNGRKKKKEPPGGFRKRKAGRKIWRASWKGRKTAWTEAFGNWEPIFPRRTRKSFWRKKAGGRTGNWRGLGSFFRRKRRSLPEKKELSIRIPEKEREKEKTEQQISQWKQKRAEAESRSRGAGEQAERLKAGLTRESREQAEQQIRSLQAEGQTLEKALEEAKENRDTAARNLSALEGRIRQLKELLEQSGEIDGSVQENRKVLLTERREELLRAQKVLHARTTANRQALFHMEQRVRGTAEAGGKVGLVVQSLSNTANGNLAGKEKIMLETYIQMTYFDRIIRRAQFKVPGHVRGAV